MSGAAEAPGLAGRRGVLAGLGALSAALLAGCAAPDGLQRPAAAAPRVRLGDEWRYERINRYNGQRLGETRVRVTAVAPQLRLAVTGAGAPPDGTEEIHAAPWRVLQEPAYDLVQVFETPQPLLPERLEPGAGSFSQTRYRVPGSDDWFYWSAQTDARRWETVEVPAGRFEALRVERRIAFQHQDLFRVRAARIDTLWYAPEVNRWVRREWTGSYRRYGMEREVGQREDWVISNLLEYRPAPG